VERRVSAVLPARVPPARHRADPDGRKSDVLRCPLDRPQGRAGLPPADRGVPISDKSAWLLWDYDSGYETWKALIELDSNPILMRCCLHDDAMRRRMLEDPVQRGAFQNARSLVLRKDGSVALARRQDHAEPLVDSKGHATQDFKRDSWSNASDVPCPPRICDGKVPPDVPMT